MAVQLSKSMVLWPVLLCLLASLSLRLLLPMLTLYTAAMRPQEKRKKSFMAGKAKQTKTSISIGLRIRKARQKKDLTAKDFGKIMKIAAPTISSWELGKAAFPADQLVHIAKKLGVSPAWLLTGEGKAIGEGKMGGDEEKED